jgi:histidine ammonia-lyase
VVYDTIRFVKGILDTEMNSATDNPMVLADKVPGDTHCTTA